MTIGQLLTFLNRYALDLEKDIPISFEIRDQNGEPLTFEVGSLRCEFETNGNLSNVVLVAEEAE